ncbi:MAG: S9 family peptidase [bacterium]|nr:MAG: S9 family peptidase [bacterium]
MSLKTKFYYASLLHILIIGAHHCSIAQIPANISIEWIFSRYCKQLQDVPDYFWTENGAAIIYDHRITAKSNTYERLNLSTLEREPILDMNSALKNLAEYIPSQEVPERLPWPIEFNSSGTQAVFTFQNDIFLLDIESARFTRVTRSTEIDTCVHFSSDDKKLSYVCHNDLFVYHIDSGQEERLTSDGSADILNGRLSWVYWEEIFGHKDQAYWWSQDSRSLVFMQTDESELGTMYFMDFKPQFPRVLTQRYPKTGQPNPKVRLGIVTLGNPEITWVRIDPNEYEYIIRVNWLPDDKQFAVQTLDRSQTKLNLYLVERETGETKFLMQETDPAWIEVHDDLIFLRSKPEFLWTSERSGYNHLYRFDMAGNLIQPITSGQWSLFSSEGVSWVSKAVMGVDEMNGWIYFTALEKSSIERHLYRIQWDGSGMDRISREEGTHKIGFSPDRKFYFDEYSSASRLPVLQLHRNDGTLLLTFDKKVQNVEESGLQTRQFFTIMARDNFEMPAFLLKPENFDPAKKYPVIVNIYGGPASPKVVDEWKSSLFFDNILLDRGYLIFSVDNRSASGISKQLQRTTLKQLWGDVELFDLLDAISWLKNQTFVDKDRLGIWGHSGGGMYTLLAMTRSEEFKAGIAVAPVTDWLYYDTRYTEFAMKTPQDNPQGYEHTSLVKRAADLHGRLLLIHGTYDDNVHIQNSWAFADELIRNNIQFDMMIYPMRKHGIDDTPAKIHRYTRMLEFWIENL